MHDKFLQAGGIAVEVAVFRFVNAVEDRRDKFGGRLRQIKNSVAGDGWGFANSVFADRRLGRRLCAKREVMVTHAARNQHHSGGGVVAQAIATRRSLRATRRDLHPGHASQDALRQQRRFRGRPGLFLAPGEVFSSLGFMLDLPLDRASSWIFYPGVCPGRERGAF